MSYAAAINEHLGVGVQPVPHVMPLTRGSAPKPATRERSGDLGHVHVDQHRGHGFIVRERGCVSFFHDPAPWGYWSAFFTDEELILENEKGDMQARIQACKNAIDRWLMDDPVWTGLWWMRPLTL